MTEMIIIVEDTGEVVVSESDDVVREISEEGQPGRGVVSTTVDVSGHLILTFTDGGTTDAGLVRGASGDSASFTQPIAQSVWGPIEHNLGRSIVNAVVYSLDYSIQWDEFITQPIDDNNCYLSFDLPVSGIALIE